MCLRLRMLSHRISTLPPGSVLCKQAANRRQSLPPNALCNGHELLQICVHSLLCASALTPMKHRLSRQSGVQRIRNNQHMPPGPRCFWPRPDRNHNTRTVFCGKLDSAKQPKTSALYTLPCCTCRASFGEITESSHKQAICRSAQRCGSRTVPLPVDSRAHGLVRSSPSCPQHLGCIPIPAGSARRVHLFQLNTG